ncbi:UDP-N-acetylglucosamine 4,6-dehydratase [Pseudoalteromonas ruthenica]|uniref:UDP-N-acetylglucosamine 4,6-dehydratase n=1 Tax=Pseudoalteromonas ruthenica TaxID=151081 RepID=A0A5S3Z7T5_9GAMM|nr:UDP-N-acetylglucosamine 4,6-dehydratase [Pseudoalteromonas ruthenica]TMP87915.1 UDP-N-acetylglucosamine 4,6-dehydratase [Pseudoalteromonas ruthenica]
MMDILRVVSRSQPLFSKDLTAHEQELSAKVSASRFLVLGGAGTIGQAVCKEIFKRSPQVLHVIDISENNLVELVRDIRSSLGYIEGDFQTFALDIGSLEYRAFIEQQPKYDYVLNLSALKHVRSEKDPYTLMRMINTNIFNTEQSLRQAIAHNSSKYFSVSTDKAANPVNMMGASKRIMEMFLMRASMQIPVSMARFANVAFSDGSLLHGFNQRLLKQQPIVAPSDVKRYFVTPTESGQLCLMSCLLGDNGDIFFPKLSDELHLQTFSEIAKAYLHQRGYEPFICESEQQARELVHSLPQQGQWPCLFSSSDTTGEKDIEEFYTPTEELDMTRFDDLGIVKSKLAYDSTKLSAFVDNINAMKSAGRWSKADLVAEFIKLLPEFSHTEMGRYLDGKM